jgi:tetratricopeptide (TPR) repeat protein
MRLCCIIILLSTVTTLFAQKQAAATNLSPEQMRKVNELLSKGGAIQNKEPQKAVQLYSEAISIAPKEPKIYIIRGFVFLSLLRNLDAADADFSRAIQLAPKLASAHYYRGLTRIDAQMLMDAEKDITNAIALGMKEGKAYMNLAVTQAMLRKYPEAINNISLAVKLAPKNYLMYYERANLYRSVGKYREAIKDYDQTLKLKPDHLNAYINRGAAKGMLQDFQGAANDYTYLIENTPPNVLNYYNRGYIFFLGKQYDRALEDFSSALKVDSGALRSNVMLINTYSKLGRNADVIRAATRFLKANAQDAQGFTNAGGAVQAYLKTDDFVNGEVFFARAEARKRIGDTEGACKDAVKAAALGYPQASQELATYCPAATVFEPSPSFPEHMQFFPREANDSANVQLSGVLLQGGFDSVYAELFRNGEKQYRIAAPIQYYTVLRGTESIQQASISLSCRIRAELAVYSIRFGVKSTATDTVLAERDSLVCGDVYFVSGQSNAVLGSVDALRHREFLRTYSFGHNDSFWGIAAANNNTDDYNVGGLALQMMSRIADEQNVPVCVLNGALSASTIEQHLRRDESLNDPKSWYDRLRWRAKKSGLWKAAKAMIWYQGESNQGGGYTEKFAQLYNAWKQDYPNLQKIYVVQIRPSDCGQTDQALLRERQRQLPRQFPDVELIASVGVPSHDGCHFGNEGYIELGNRLYGFVRRDFYQNAAQNVPAFSSPSLQRARWISADKKELALEFAPTDSLVATPDTLVGGTLRTLANDAFLFDGAPAKVSSVRIEKNIVRLSFAAPQTATRISYIPDRCYADATNVGAPCVVYQGPWLVSSLHCLAAPTFHDVAIDDVE